MEREDSLWIWEWIAYTRTQVSSPPLYPQSRRLVKESACLQMQLTISEHCCSCVRKYEYKY